MVKIKKCSNPLCKVPNKPETNEFYYEYKAYNKKLGNHLKFASECRECRKQRSLRDRHINVEMTRERDRIQYYKRRDTELPRMRQDYRLRKKERDETLRKWYKNNPNKRKEYSENHQKHEITEDEWFACLDYFDWACGYCGLTWEEHVLEIGQALHKDHTNHDGNNFVDNCTPACRQCNSSKHDKKLIDWYNEDNPNFKKRRLNKIIKWSTKDWEKYT